jgi:hypothetical protein
MIRESCIGTRSRDGSRTSTRTRTRTKSNPYEEEKEKRKIGTVYGKPSFFLSMHWGHEPQGISDLKFEISEEEQEKEEDRDGSHRPVTAVEPKQ